VYQFIHDILIGDDSDTLPENDRLASNSWHSSEDGMVSFVGMVAVLFFLILIGLVGNVGLSVNQKIEIQNAADSTTYSSGVFIARGMNSVTASNHIIGELLALCVIQHSLRGPEGDQGASPFQSTRIGSSERSEARSTKSLLSFTYTVTKIVQVLAFPAPRLWSDSIYQRINRWNPSSDGATIFRSKLRLAKVLKSNYRIWGAGAGMQSFIGMTAVFFANLGFPPNVPYAIQEANNSRNRGRELCQAANIWAEKVGREWQLLETVGRIAQSMTPAKTAMKGMILALHQSNHIYASGASMNPLHRKLLDSVDEEHEVASVTYFGRVSTGQFSGAYQLMPDLPITPEPANLSVIRKSQLVRATYPWVNYWRQPIMKLFRATLRLSRAAHHYKDFSNQFTIELAQELKRPQGSNVNLYVLKELDLERSDKGHEKWTERSSSADSLRDRLFTHVGFARRDAPPVVSAAFYKEENKDGFVCYSQGILYNANLQVPAKTRQNMQPRVAWDTLAWVNDVPEFRDLDGHRAWTGSGGESDPPDHEPRLFLNWHTKLVPVSRLTEASQSLPPEFAAAVNRLPINTQSQESAQFRTH
jgi:hypothetical protein